MRIGSSSSAAAKVPEDRMEKKCLSHPAYEQTLSRQWEAHAGCELSFSWICKACHVRCYFDVISRTRATMLHLQQLDAGDVRSFAVKRLGVDQVLLFGSGNPNLLINYLSFHQLWCWWGAWTYWTLLTFSKGSQAAVFLFEGSIRFTAIVLTF